MARSPTELPSALVSVRSWAASASTVTDSEVDPTSMTTSTVVVSPAFRSMPVRTNFLKQVRLEYYAEKRFFLQGGNSLVRKDVRRDFLLLNLIFRKEGKSLIDEQEEEQILEILGLFKFRKSIFWNSQRGKERFLSGLKF